MRASTVTGVGLMVAVGLSLGTARAGPPVEDDEAATELKDHHRHHQHGGISRFVEMSLDTLGEDESRSAQVDKLQAELHACIEPTEEKEKDVLLMIADGLAAGSVDAAKVEASIAQLSTAAMAIHACVAGPLNQLHATLSAVERAALADKVQAHWGVWRHVNHEAPPGGREQGGQLAHLGRDLSLTPDQVEKMSSALRPVLAGHAAKFDPEKVKGLVQKFAADFVGTAFDARSVATNTTAFLTAYGTTRMALFYETITPLLTPSQRTALAAHLREHANHHPAIQAPSKDPR